jgi:pimeloyl-ACP methyl ester carboxylesterase
VASQSLAASDGVALHVEIEGTGIPVVFSCGYATTLENFRPQVAPLLDAGARVGLWDLRGHGRSGAPAPPEGYSFPQVLDDLARVVELVAGPVPAVLAGFSFGGLLSLHFALAHPERVRALVLIDTGPGFKNPEARARWQAQVERTAEILERGGFEAFLAGKGATTAIGRRPELPAAQAAARAIARQDVAGVAQFGRRIAGPAPGCIDELGRIRAPTLVVVGEEDEAYLRAADVMVARLPRATRFGVAGAGHVVTLEEPDALNEAILDFLAELDGAPPAE